jgi:hypothetical protein
MDSVLICVDDNRDLVKEVRRILSESEPFIIRGSRYFTEPNCSCDFTPDREYDWYRKFEKKSKRSNFK